MVTKSKKSTPVVEIEETYMPDADETITFKRSHFYSALVVLAFGVGLMLGYVLWGRGAVAAAPAAGQPSAAQDQPSGPLVAAPTAEPQPPSRYDISIEGYPSFGPDDAPITIVEFSDFQCPYCRRFHEQTYQALLDAYPGQIRFVYRNLPLTSIHPEAMPAAVASLCANDQNVYWDYHEKLFSSDALGRTVYVQYATDLEVDVEEFTACLDSGKHDDFIQQDMQYAFSIGVQSTPTFFVNGLAIVGAQPLLNFQQLIDQELAGEIP
ncbi:MAG: thioredoxin domain-containing protein [Anaerolineales bacterium]|jgi:protein-disulfide isomerase|nr:thioredoxin domain-containing protein [Anaerolineales bacterium]